MVISGFQPKVGNLSFTLQIIVVVVENGKTKAINNTLNWLFPIGLFPRPTSIHQTEIMVVTCILI